MNYTNGDKIQLLDNVRTADGRTGKVSGFSTGLVIIRTENGIELFVDNSRLTKI